MNFDTLTTTDAVCYHCGEYCDGESVTLEDKNFCCDGCRLVYKILDGNDLNTYYCLEDRPGVSFKEYEQSRRFDFLDDNEVIDKLAEFRSSGLVNVSLYIPNIHCTSCVWLLENLFKLDPGITRSSVNFLKRSLSITYEENQTGLRKIVELLASIGYEPEFHLEELKRDNPASPQRRLWLKLGVAGFAFGNIMLFSFPEYLSGSTLNAEGSFHWFFGLLNIALALPVLLFSATDYLKSAWAAVRQKGINLDVPIAAGILALFTRSVYEIVTGTGAGYMDSFSGLVFFLLIGRILQNKTYQRLSFDRDYKSYLPISVTTVGKGGEERSVTLDRLKKQMRMLLRNRELVPADARLLSDICYVDYSFITGEAEPVKVERGEKVFAGGRVMGPSVVMSVVKEVSDSHLTKLWNNSAFKNNGEDHKVSSLADRISPHFTLAVIGMAITAGIFWWPVSVEMSLTVFTAVLIIACPCALALSTPFTLGSAMNVLSRNGFYVRGLKVIENLAGATSLVFDKTGTLTRADRAEIRFHGKGMTEEEKQMVQAVCRHSLHPLSQKIQSSIPAGKNMQVRDFNEELNKGIEARVNGMLVTVGSASFVASRLPEEPSVMSRDGETASGVHVAFDRLWKGWFEIGNAYRPGIREILATFRNRFATYLLSGDNAAQKAEFTDFFKPSALCFNRTPQQKLDFVQGLQKKGDRVVMIGDGLNDAGALRQSDFGIVLTDKVSSFTPACDAIMEGESMPRLPDFIDFSRSSISVIKASFGLSLLYNVVGLGFAVTGYLSPLVAAILMPLSSISIMLFTTAATHLIAKKRGLITWK